MSILLIGVEKGTVKIPSSLAPQVVYLAKPHDLFSRLEAHPGEECTAVIRFGGEDELSRFNASLRELVCTAFPEETLPGSPGLPPPSPGPSSVPAGHILPRVALVACFPDFFPRDPAQARAFDYVVLHPLEQVDISSLVSHVSVLREHAYEIRREMYFKSVIADLLVERLQHLQDGAGLSGSGGFYYAVDTRGIVRMMSGRMAEKLGYSRDEVVGRHIDTFMREPEKEEARAFTERRTGDRRSRGILVEIRNSRGGYEEFVIDALGVHLPPVGRPERYPFREHLGTVGVASGPALDVFSRSFIPLFIYDESAGKLQVNRGFEEFSGYRRDEVRDKTPDFFESAEVDGFSFYSGRMKETGHLAYNTFFIDRGGTRRLCEASIDRLDIGGRTFYVRVYNDISGLMKFFETAEILFQLSWAIERSGTLLELLEKIARRCASLLEVPFMGMVVRNDQGDLLQHYHLASRGVAPGPEQLRYQASACLGPLVEQVFKHGKSLSCTREVLGEPCRFLPEDEAGVFVLTPLAAGSEVQGCFITAHPERNAHAVQVLRLLDMLSAVITTGIQRYLLEDRLRKSYQELEQRVEERTAELQDFVYTVSHDLKSPLHAARGFAEMIGERLSGKLSSEEDLFVLRRLDGNITQSIAMIDHLLTLSRLGTSEMEIDTVDLKSIIQDFVLEHQALNQGVSLDVQMDEDLPAIQGDRKRLLQLFNNLFDNSVKYRRTRTVSISVSARVDNGWATISVRDEGEGIAREDLSQVFKMFYRGRNACKGSAEGSGVGLAIARKIVEQHGGSIRIESNPGEGTTVVLTLPAA
jgi:PAS domain S-box-containing protein